MDWYTTVPPAYAQYRFADFWKLDPEKMAGKDQAIQAMYQYSQNNAWLGSKRGIVLAGDFGVGKSCLLWSMMRHLNWQDYGMRSCNSFLLDTHSKHWAHQINKAMTFKLFVLEECWQDPRRGRMSRVNCYPAITILGERLAANKPTILVASHKNKAEFYQLWREELTTIIDKHCIWLELGGVRLRDEGIRPDREAF
jgi:hypothetical protein